VKIKILGTGCSRCHQLGQTVKDVVKDLGIEASFEEVKDIKKIMSYPILTTPGLVVNEEVVCSGRVPNKAEVTQLIVSALEKEQRSQG
jgi:small redox-active disulfide protein 2